MAKTPEQDARKVASTARRPSNTQAQAAPPPGTSAEQKKAAQPGNVLQQDKAPTRATTAPQEKTAPQGSAGQAAPAPQAAAAPRRSAPKQAPQQRTFLAGAQPEAQPTQAHKRAGKAAPDKASAAQKTAQTDTANLTGAPAAKPAPASDAALSKARPRKRTDAASSDAKGRATRNTVPLHSTTILHLEQIARSMQRGVNDGALVEAEGSDRLPFRLVLNALGQILYRIGLQFEYAILRIGRTVKHGFRLLAMGILLLLRTFLRPIGGLFAGIWRDLSSPFVRLYLGVRHAFQVMRDASGRGESAFAAGVAYAKQGFKAYRHIGATALSYLLPLAAASILALTVWSVLKTPFSLAVTYNDKMIGYVESEAVWESAKKRVADRIRASSPDETFDARPQFNVVSVQVDARRDVLDMVDVIISESSDQIQSATGVYIGDTLAGICTDGAGVQQMLDTTLTAALPQDDPSARVEFVNSVTTETGLYFTDSISTLTQLESTLQSNNWLQVKLLRTEVHNEPIPFESVEEENPNAYKGSTRVKQRGVDGEKVVTDDVSYINGVEIDRVTLSEEIIKEPVNRITTVGTKQTGGAGSYNGSVMQGSGALIWPVPNYSYTTTEFGGHRGLDICAPYGSQVLACDSGTVVEAGWHWSWGNYILIDHGNGITTRYAHNSQLIAVLGQNVAQGQLIALVGSTGTSSGNHCHLEVTVNGGLVNPRAYLS